MNKFKDRWRGYLGGGKGKKILRAARALSFLLPLSKHFLDYNDIKTIIVVDVWLNSLSLSCAPWVSKEDVLCTLETRVHQIYIFLSSDIKYNEKPIDPSLLFY